MKFAPSRNGSSNIILGTEPVGSTYYLAIVLLEASAREKGHGLRKYIPSKHSFVETTFKGLNKICIVLQD